MPNKGDDWAIKHSVKLYKTGEALATGKAKTRKEAMTIGGYSPNTALSPTDHGITVERALRAYETQRPKRGGGVIDAAKTAEEKIVAAMSDEKIPLQDRLNIAKWVAEFGRKVKLESGATNAATLQDLIRFRVAIMRSIQKGVALALRDPERAIEITERIGNKIEQLALAAMEDRLRA